MNPIEEHILEVAARRIVRAHVEARLTGFDIKKVRRVIQSLVRRKLLYQCEKPLRNYFGSGEAGYRRLP
jgi:hypothetical protein